MSPEDFKAWRSAMGFSQTEAAAALDISKGSIELYERGARRDDGRPVLIPRTVELACSALASTLIAARAKPAFPAHGIIAAVRFPEGWYFYAPYPPGYEDERITKQPVFCKTLEEVHTVFMAHHHDEPPAGRRSERKYEPALAVGSIIEFWRKGGGWERVVRDPVQGGMQIWQGQVASFRDMIDDTRESFGVS
ncbi:hypothetical protein C8J35_103508 [Rhizobium sp. PP-F2F-G38]|nr:hypothetical protein C8J35_103508 [Rhizobium sp. PP-F2F-G38]